jgi:hypothetical protein
MATGGRGNRAQDSVNSDDAMRVVFFFFFFFKYFFGLGIEDSIDEFFHFVLSFSLENLQGFLFFYLKNQTLSFLFNKML